MPILDWLNKKDALKTAGKVPYRLLKPNKDLSYGDQSLGNMLIKGDNLDTLKALLPYYKGQVKCIYIDPPYNTLKRIKKDGSPLGYDDNLEHSIWLDMMYPRLELLSELLSNNGVIWISLNDDESAYCKVMCDEIFGRKNFLSDIIWNSTKSVTNTAIVSDSHTHTLVYFKNKQFWVENRTDFRVPESGTGFSNPDNDPRGSWKADPFQVGGWRPNQQYEIVNPKTGKVYLPNKGASWKNDHIRFKELLADNRIIFGKNGTAGPQRKRFLFEAEERGRVVTTIWSDLDTTTNATQHAKQLFGEDVFPNPKPEDLIQRIFQLSTKQGDLILDSFLGSGTTASVAQKMSRRYIGIEMADHADTYCVPRLKKVIDGTDKGGITEAQNWQGGGGFTFYELGPAIFDAHGNINRDIDFKTLAFHVWFTETKTPMQKYSHSPLLGVCEDTAYYLLYNGILGDKSVSGGNVLTAKLLSKLPKHSGKKIIYGEACRLSLERLNAENIIFKQTPYDIKAR